MPQAHSATGVAVATFSRNHVEVNARRKLASIAKYERLAAATPLDSQSPFIQSLRYRHVGEDHPTPHSLPIQQPGASTPRDGKDN
jgi:hypothetical protein